MRALLFANRAIAAGLLFLLATLAGCSSSSSSGPPCTGKEQGGSCTVPEDCKPPASCKCVDGTDTAVDRACVRGVCDARTNCELQCRTHFGIETFRVCS